MDIELQKALQQLVERDDPDIDLVEGALLIARAEYPDLDPAPYRARIDAYADAVRRKLFRGADIEDVIHGLNVTLFDEAGFRGNDDDYYDPRNSFLNEVLDRRLGIPITLSIVYLAVGRRVGLPIEGVSFPGHFLVKVRDGDEDWILDPYSGGVRCTPADLHDMLERLFGTETAGASLDRWLAGARPRDVLVRLLRNVKGIYFNTEQWNQALSAVNRILALDPASEAEWRERAELHERLECFRAALQDYERYLELAPADAGVLAPIRTRVIALRSKVGSLH